VIEQLQEALRRAGLESSNLILAIDYTKSNTVRKRKKLVDFAIHIYFLYFGVIVDRTKYFSRKMLA